LRTMLRLGAERPELRVVCDQHGSPTWCRVIAQATVELVQRDETGLLHLACREYTSWYDFATAIFALTRLPGKSEPHVIPIESDEYEAAAIRPRNSRLCTRRIEKLIDTPLPDWRTALAACIAKMN
jgi:dTDP-4-dehydrorhamnose reductase